MFYVYDINVKKKIIIQINCKYMYFVMLLKEFCNVLQIYYEYCLNYEIEVRVGLIFCVFK